MKIKDWLNYSKFFIKISHSYMKPWKLKDLLYFPKAYIKFMRQSGKDIKEDFKCS